MNEILLTILEKFRKPFWRVFLLSWITWNWQIWYLTIFIGNDDIQGNKLDFIVNKYSYFEIINPDLNFLNSILFPQLGIIIHWVIFPTIISYLIVWYFPIVTDKFLEKNKENKERENKILKDTIESDTKVVEAQKENLEKKIEVKEILKENKYEEWTEELKSITKIGYLNSLSDLIYKYNGEISDDDWQRRFSVEFEQFIDLLGLAKSMGNSRGSNKYSLTEKGKFFLKKNNLGNNI